ncbi:hypothetical protein AGOR_G00243920 [Albula goreensis]|uniref:Uncharacterized protein n=1 Tax=Albula goreensis TaxID=1534307 RepID=A0A8T3CJP9_9TELE|nr:hypothetical protein AGOR_G00243920 [Albula goreensis]
MRRDRELGDRGRALELTSPAPSSASANLSFTEAGHPPSSQRGEMPPYLRTQGYSSGTERWFSFFRTILVKTRPCCCFGLEQLERTTEYLRPGQPHRCPGPMWEVGKV